ncbi:MAG: RluA family pseudouridine synthase [Dorea sp.]|nr:RluA family pseudouridine synthase [Dorea sp.]
MNLQSLDVLYEDTHILVCIKPSGTATQSRSIKSPDMESILKNHIAKSTACKNFFANSFAKEPYLAVIHRLDQPVQGIMVFAKTPFAAKELSRQLQTDNFGKYYRALVSCKPSKASDTLEDYMRKNKKDNVSRICQKETPGAKLARLSYRTVPKSEQYFMSGLSELDIHLHTGRHHQIRVQLANIGCPVVGDTKYNPQSAETSGWQELKLCSYRLEFTHPKTKKPMSFSLI